MQKTILKGTIIIPQETIEGGSVLMEGDRIAAVGRSSEVSIPEGAEVKDFGGKFICPGFIDVHVQGAGGCDVLDSSYDAINAISKTLAKFGTTSFLATTVIKDAQQQKQGGKISQPHLESVVEAMEKGVDGARVLGTHLESPFINKNKRGMIQEENVTSPDMDFLKKIYDITGDSLKMMTMAPELDGNLGLISWLKEKGIVVSIGHTLADYQQALKGIEAGITHATHVFNAMPSIHHRDPGCLLPCLIDEGLTVQLIADGAHIHPAIVKMILKLKSIKGIALITDSMSVTGAPDSTHIYDGQEYFVKEDGQVVYSDGTLIGTALTLNKIIKNMQTFTGIGLKEAVSMATITPARILGLDDTLGSLESGKDADIVVMDEECNVELVISKGIVKNKKEHIGEF